MGPAKDTQIGCSLEDLADLHCFTWWALYVVMVSMVVQLFVHRVNNNRKALAFDMCCRLYLYT